MLAGATYCPIFSRFLLLSSLKKSGNSPPLNFNSLSINILLFATFTECAACSMLLYICCSPAHELSLSAFLFFGVILQNEIQSHTSHDISSNTYTTTIIIPLLITNNHSKIYFYTNTKIFSTISKSLY
ncbi:hypothetical protein Fmac_021361 [Flemingia macrophylla]|uniref:Uncharacterized protein n=1 Tax=Flemingia macrophylla TaxID=520843 RepID=A0ABD1LWL5_9FABA